LGITRVRIIQPETSQPFQAGETIAFHAERSPGIDSYNWDFGDGRTASSPSPSHAFNNPGAYSVKLTAYFEGCSGTDSISVQVNGCSSDEQCPDAKECRDRICIEKEIPANYTEQNLTEIIINIISPANKEYDSLKIPLEYKTSPQGIECSYSLNNDPSYTKIQPSTKEIMARRGENTLRILCNGNTASVSFRVMTEDDNETIFDEFKGEQEGSIFDLLRDDGIEQELSEQDAQRLLVDVLESQDLSITKFAETKANSTLVMVNVKNTLGPK